MERSILPITKMHGLGNSYIFINAFECIVQEEELPHLAVRLSDVNVGVGSDGLIVIGPSQVADFYMRIFNKDGSEGKNCGNGLRCVAKYVYEKQLTDKQQFLIETLSGVVQVQLHVTDQNVVESVTVDMGPPRLTKKEIPMLGDPESIAIDEEITILGGVYRITAVSMGNPHAVIFDSDVWRIPLETIGPVIEKADIFPEGVNVEFVQQIRSNELLCRVWERGSGATQACGTGACATVVAGVLNGKFVRGVPVTVHLPGGKLTIEWSDRDGHVYMRGPAEFIFDGRYFSDECT